ncbi:mechanosensitive ion channel [Ancylothrix sp. C2]|uniref:mechanosensitive ion channel n=1 Tax=Ancylothrix sp. D3o TaxID=2953691 RepID=UPI0021BB0BEE|nr:mechanosensitive ion channel [Ancylothrix sp. D3o]MCT7948701.1 mechanosensitive ion channel [Ancylothrix sp. D3o]
MIENLQNICLKTGVNLPAFVHPLLGQTRTAPAARPATQLPPGVASVWNFPVGETTVGDIAVAFAILLIGFIVAALISSIVQGLLKKTNIDNRIAGWIGNRPQNELPDVEKWIGTAVFWLIIIFFLVPFFDKLKLGAASQPLTSLLNQVTIFLPKLLAAGALLAVAWVLATITKFVVSRALRAIGIDERLNQEVRNTSQNQFLLSETFGNALYWFIFLLFLPSILSTLELQGTLQPVQQLLNEILLILPNILAAILIGAAGWFIAQIVRRIVTNLLAATGTDSLGARFGLSPTSGSQSLSWLTGTVVYILILIPTAIAALNALKIDAISGPAISMLTQILNAIPQIFTAGLILVVAYFLGRFVADLVTNILTGIGFNNVFNWIGLNNVSTTRTPTASRFVEPVEPIDPMDRTATVIQPSTTVNRTPSEIVGIIVLVGIMLFAAVTATDVLNLPALTAIVAEILAIAGRVLVGVIVFAIGLYLANLAFNIIRSSGTSQANFLAQSARVAIITLVGAMALQQMGIASSIVNLAFGLLFGAVAVAIALSFGLGGREIAAEQIRQWLAEFKEKK